MRHLTRISLFLFLISIFPTFFFAQNVKFAVITDIHKDIMHDADARLTTFLKAAKKQKVNFIIELGDFSQLKKENKAFDSLWDAYSGDKYRVLGNHDFDNCNLEQYLKDRRMNSGYYSFDRGNVHFVVLDANYIKVDGKYTHYSHGNFYLDAKKRAWIDPVQLRWLKEDIRKTDKRCVIFSHQSLENTISNREEIRAFFENENKRVGYKKIIAALNGHDHTDYQKVINGITYIQINSASNQWVGAKYACPERYSKEINDAHPYLKSVVPYQDALYAVVAIKKNKFKLKGIKSVFVPPTPGDLGIPSDIYPFPLVPYISNYSFKFKY